MLRYVRVHTYWLIEITNVAENSSDSKFHILSFAKQLVRFGASYCANPQHQAVTETQHVIFKIYKSTVAGVGLGSLVQINILENLQF
jgi:hypothetical protein